MQGLDNSTALLVIQEKIPKSDESITYGLILDYAKMNLEMCETITHQGMLNKRDDSHFWSPDEMSMEWDIIDEQRRQSHQTAAGGEGLPPKPSPKKKTSKRKLPAGGPGDAVEEAVPKRAKKGKGPVTLTIQKAVNMIDVEVNKLSQMT